MTSFAPQFLVDDLARSMTFYQKLGFTFGAPCEGFYAIAFGGRPSEGVTR